MPELPEVETVRRGLAPVMEGATISEVLLTRPDLRFPFPENFANRLEGSRIKSLGRRAKFLVAGTDRVEALIMHLGMSGSFRIELEEALEMPGIFHHPRSDRKTHDHVVFRLETQIGPAKVIYNDPRRFGFMDLLPADGLANSKHFSGMGVEPTGNELSGETLAPESIMIIWED